MIHPSALDPLQVRIVLTAVQPWTTLPRWSSGGLPVWVVPVPEPEPRLCSQPNCVLPICGLGLCEQHYMVSQKAAGRYGYRVWGEMVYERDKRICHLCGGHIPRAAVWPNPWSFSLDHVQPQSLGGFHDHSNLRSAHLRCNQSRGNTLMEELNPPEGPDYRQRFTNWWGDWRPSFPPSVASQRRNRRR
jgi:hypothetical protein